MKTEGVPPFASRICSGWSSMTPWIKDSETSSSGQQILIVKEPPFIGDTGKEDIPFASEEIVFVIYLFCGFLIPRSQQKKGGTIADGQKAFFHLAGNGFGNL